MENEKIHKFLNAKSKRELAQALDVEFSQLAYNLYILKDEERYIEFEINKRRNGKRLIIAPILGIKHIQHNLSKILLEIYKQKKCVHGYVKEKGIKTNAAMHVNKKILINIDLKNFFPTINFGRVRGIFKSYPFNFEEEIATTLAQICCYKGFLPQGASTSPIISNFICRKLDNNLIDLASKGRFDYTRYADDITFSTNIFPIPKELGKIIENKIELSEELINIVNRNDFQINETKTRFAYRNNRQEVTGLIVNKFPNIKRNYIRHVRAMLNAWEKYGITLAANEHFEKYNYKNKKRIHKELAYHNELVGKITYIGMVRGKDDFIYKKLYQRIKKLNPKVKLTVVQNISQRSEFPIIFGEGKTDWKHIKSALNWFQNRGEFVNLDVVFEEYKEGLEINNIELLKICKSLSKTNFHKSKIICLFDRDERSINKEACKNNKLFRHWGNNVYSALLPIPSHRNFDEICIEHYYTDKDLQTYDKNGRRIFLSNEFEKETAKHLKENLQYMKKNYLQANYPRILDSEVFNPDNGENKALPKNDFADYILNKTKPFDKLDFNNFKIVFDLLSEIINQNENEIVNN